MIKFKESDKLKVNSDKIQINKEKAYTNNHIKIENEQRKNSLNNKYFIKNEGYNKDSFEKKDMKNFITSDNSFVEEYMNLSNGSGNLQLGYNHKDKKIIFMASKKNEINNSANFSYNKKIEESRAKVVKKDVSPQNAIMSFKDNNTNNVATAFIFNNEIQSNKVDKSYLSINNKDKKNTAFNAVTDKFEINNEKKLIKELSNQKQIDTNQANKTFIEKDIDSVNNIISKKQHNRTNYQSAIKVAINKINYQSKNSNTDNDFIEFIKKKEISNIYSSIDNTSIDSHPEKKEDSKGN